VEVLEQYQKKIDWALQNEISEADEYVWVDNNLDDGLSEIERWGEKMFGEIEEQNRVYDAIWTAIAAKQYEKTAPLKVPPWLAREVSGDYFKKT